MSETIKSAISKSETNRPATNGSETNRSGTPATARAGKNEPVADRSGLLKLSVQAGAHDRLHCPVTFRLPAAFWPEGDDPASIRMKDERGAAVPVQVIREADGATLVWIVDELPAHAAATYTVTVEEGAGGGLGFSPDAGVKLSESEHRLDVEIDGRYFTSYVYDPALAKPYIGPVIGPYGASFTRLDFKTREHPHHRSIWLGIGDVNGIDAWNEPEGRHGRQIVQSIEAKAEGPVLARVSSRQAWTNFGGKPQLEEERTATFYRTPAGLRMIDLEFSLVAKYGRVELGATKEAGPLGVRVAESMKVDNGGTMINSYGSVGEAECWGQRAQWCDYFGDVEGHTLGIAVFDHPDNEDHPTYWHIRNYGLFAPNNLYFAGGKLLKPGDTLRYRYRLLFHEGDHAAARVADRYQDYIHPPRVERLD